MPQVRLVSLLLLAASGASRLEAQALTLTQALARAERDAYPNRVAAAQADGQAAAALQPLRGVLPTFTLEGGYLRTTDPLSAFGFVLRQREVTPAAFAPAILNDPDPRGNLAAGLVMQQPLFNADALLGRRAARQAEAAAQASAAWTRSGTALDVVRAYYAAILAAERAGTLEAAYQAALAHVRQAEALANQGMATRADLLLAQVRAGEVEAQLVEARGQITLARRRLAIAMGAPGDTGFTLPGHLPGPTAVRSLAGRIGSDSGAQSWRDDLRAARWSEQAATTDARRAEALYLPRLNAFGRLDWNNPDTPFGGNSSWTLGLMLSWSPFAGGSEIAERHAARSRMALARASREAQAAQASLEAAQATEALEVALARLDIAERAVMQSREAHRLVTRRYEGGLASVIELFEAAAAETASGLAFAGARFDTIVALAGSRRAQGYDLSPLADLDSQAPEAESEAP
jgi:outer membrane protein TolC